MTTPLPPQPDAVRLPSHSRQVLTRIGAGVGLLALLAGIPVVLSVVAGFPLPDDARTWEQVKTALLTRDDGQLFLLTLTYVAWASWALLALLVLIEALAQLRGRPTPRIPGLGPIQWLARVLVTGLTAAVLATPVSFTRAPTPPPPLTVAAATAPPPQSASPSTPATEAPALQPVAQHTSATRGPTSPTGEHKTYVVKPRDTLWGIAGRFLGDGQRYPEIARLNYGRPQPDGGQLTNSHRIRAGWRLVLPADAQASSERTGTYRRYIVQTGDTLSSIAARELGDPDRYDEIARLNRDRVQPDGGRLTDPDQIQPGWGLLIPHTSREHKPPARPDKPADRDRATPTPDRPPQTTPPPTSPSQANTPQPQRSSPATSEVTNSATSPTPAAETHDHPRHGVVTLPSGAVVGGTLAVAIATAITLTYLHRRRRYRPLTDPQVNPVVPESKPAPQHLRRAYLAGEPDEGDSPVEVPPHLPGTPERTLPLVVREGREVLVAVAELGSLGLTGPGADDAARAILTSAAAGGRDITEVVVPEPDLRYLLGADPDDTTPVRVPPTVTVTNILAEALTRLEAEVLRRTRLLDSYDGTNITAFRRDHPDEEPLPAIILVTRTPELAKQQLKAVLTLGRRYDIAAVILGAWPEGTTCHVEDNGHVTEVTGPGRDRFSGGDIFHLTEADTVDLLAVLSAASGQDDEQHAEVTGADQPVAAGHAVSEVDVAGAPPTDDSSTKRQVSLTVLGPVRLYAGTEEIPTGLRSRARELLAYLASHPEGVTLEHTLADIWPDDDPDAAAVRFHTAATNIRRVLRNTTGMSQARFVVHGGGRYHLDANLIDVDLWRFHHHLRRTNTDTTDTAQAFTDALDVYHADFTSGLTYAWAEPLRENLHRTAIDACTRLAQEHEQAGQTERAVAALERAISLDRYNEDLYQRAIQLLAEIGRPDAIRRLYRQLQAQLADLDIDPDPATERLVHHYLAKHAAVTRARKQRWPEQTE